MTSAGPGQESDEIQSQKNPWAGEGREGDGTGKRGGREVQEPQDKKWRSSNHEINFNFDIIIPVPSVAGATPAMNGKW